MGTGVRGGVQEVALAPLAGGGIVITDGEESQMLLWDRLMHAG